ncbi:response regulator [Nocardia seriolae]|uniref:Chemotaxis response regulator protein-glutamate methylesterase of group 1 operon n=1 Tax=Nocardia seriolae TaxID=37332 RepID=A0ABC9YSD9_9NOCA|nr:response regulator transcription factor [Nocardia seriolae]APA98801.1 Chemotaxis response regulator protein-glutamate methylesterase of group 1 operon [Nocardia seriolae]OJF80761.1 DNA-binding response regulator [Nocardia seriolae]PSK31054.1 DNA-binding response regulator [Nocardia seriolae]QOW35295.1 response regulator transcription factor [Nocardia seriolae]QUN17240.1 response regulator transcription factor [Nocardia seriolae]
MIGVLLVDDQRLVRAGLAMLVEATPGLRVVGEAADGVTAVRAAAQLSPDLVLMDLRMPGMDGVAATRAIVAGPSAPKVLVLTTFDDDEHLFPALAAGASGYLVKDTEPEALVAAIGRVLDGELLFSPPLLRRLVARAIDAPGSPPGSATAAVDLTAREAEVLALVGEGFSNGEIADRLHLGVTTVKKHLARLMDKTGCDNRVRLAVFAVGRAH